MIQVEMSKDIREFSPKVISVFDKRQLICLGIAALYGVPVFAATSFLAIDARAILVVLITAPVVLCGWIRVYGMPFEVFLGHMVISMALTPRKRKYKTENTLDGMDAPAESAKKMGMTRKEKKKRRADLEKYGGIA